MTDLLYPVGAVLMFFVTFVFFIKTHDYEHPGGMDPMTLSMYAVGALIIGAGWPVSLVLFGGYLLLLWLSDEINKKYYSRKTSAQKAEQ